MSLAAWIETLRAPEQGALRFGLVALAIALVTARLSGGGPATSVVAVALVFGVPVLCLRLGGAAPAFALVAALGAWLVFRVSFEAGPPPIPVLLARRLAYFAAPPLLLTLALAERDKARLRLGAAHLYGPAVVIGLGAVAHVFLSARTQEHEAEMQQAATIYGLCYMALVALAVVLRLQEAPRAAARKEGPKLEKGVELEEQGRYALASRVYEREGQADKAAQSAERAGDWARAGRLYRLTGDDYNAAEMFSRAGMLKEALDAYERARAFPAAARLCVQIGDLDRAVALFEQAGDRASIVAVLEEAGRTPSAEQYTNAGMIGRAAAVHEAAGDWLRAADVYEHQLGNRARAAELHLTAGSFVHAGRLLESLGRRQEALEAFAATPAGAMDAARLCLAHNRPEEAAALLARLSPSQMGDLEDETTVIVAARVLTETGRHEEAIRMLQGLKRKGGASGAVRLLLGRAFLAGGFPDLAEEELRAATEMPLEPADELRAGYLLGCVLEESGRAAEALRAFHDIMQKDMHYEDVQVRYRRLKARVGAGTFSG